MLTLLLVVLGGAPVLELRPVFEARAEAPKDAERRALYDAYRAQVELWSGPLSDVSFAFREVRQPFLGRRKVFVATGWAMGGHRPLPTMWLVREKKETLVLLAASRALDRDGYHQVLEDVRLCPAGVLLDEARTVRDGGAPDPGRRARDCASVGEELRKVAVAGGDLEARAEALTLLLSALVDSSEPGVTVTTVESLSKGYLDTLAGKVSPGFQRFAPRAKNVTPFFTTVKEGQLAAQGLVRSGRGARTLEVVRLIATAATLEFDREQLAREIQLIE